MNKMSISMKEIRKNWSLTRKQIRDAEESLQEGDLENTICFTWLAAENLMNTIKLFVNGYFTTSHRRKIFDSKRFYLKGILKKDYSNTIKKLSKLRLVAAFVPYTKAKGSYTEEDAKRFLNDIKSLAEEIKIKLKKARII